jgi:hypothetical protein
MDGGIVYRCGKYCVWMWRLSMYVEDIMYKRGDPVHKCDR